MKRIGLIVVVLITIGVVWLGYDNRGIGPALAPPAPGIVTLLAGETPPLTSLSGFSIEVFARDLPGVRVMAFDQKGNLWVSQTKEGKVSYLNPTADNAIAVTALPDLKNPHGLAFDPTAPTTLYIAEENRIIKFDVDCVTNDIGLPCTPAAPEKIIDLPADGRHTTRTIAFGPDGRLYVSIGSSCDVCHEDDPRRAAIYSMNKDGTDFRPVAAGLRNAVFFTWYPSFDFPINFPADPNFRPPTYALWTTEMGRDNLGDNLPPDEINVIPLPPLDAKVERFVPDFGWPICYGQNIHDSDFDKNVYIRDPCADKSPSTIDLPAHSAPLGLAFVPEDGNWPEEYLGSLLVAYHGSWNRSVPTGYKVARFEKGFWDHRFRKSTDPNYNIDKDFRVPPDFISGWLTIQGEALGRPVDLKFKRVGGPYFNVIDSETGKTEWVNAPFEDELYISDDKAGVIYRVRYDPDNAN